MPPYIRYINEIITLFDFSLLQSLVDSTDIGFIKDYQERNPDAIFKHLKSLTYNLTVYNDFIVNLKECKFPTLESLTIIIVFE